MDVTLYAALSVTLCNVALYVTLCNVVLNVILDCMLNLKISVCQDVDLFYLITCFV